MSTHNCSHLIFKKYAKAYAEKEMAFSKSSVEKTGNLHVEK